MSMNSGMTLEQRKALRAEILERELAKARGFAAAACVSLKCRHANEMAESGKYTEDQVKAAHVSCLGEAMGSGCLDPCHDPAE
jgi:hypothetical protein